MVTGGGASMPAKLYKGSADSILPINFSYAASGSGIGKTAFLMNNPMLLGATTGTVHYIGSDSILSSSELSAYSTNYRGAYGPLIQIPLAGTAVTIPYKKPDITDLNLTSAQLCDAFPAPRSLGQLLGNPADRTPIRIVYQRGGSGATELLTRHLNSVCPTRFATNSIFTNARLPAGGALPSNWVAVQPYESVRNAVDNVSGSIGYEGPDGVDLSDNSKIARVNGLLPTLANRVIAVRSVVRRVSLQIAPIRASGYRSSSTRTQATHRRLYQLCLWPVLQGMPLLPPTCVPSLPSIMAAPLQIER